MIKYFNTNSKMKKNLFLIIQDSNQSYGKINHAQTSKNIWNGSQYSTQYKSRSKTPKQQSKSPSYFKSPKYRGIMQKNIQDRLAYYVKLNKMQKTQLLNQKCLKENQQDRQCKQKPQINQISKQLYKKIKQQRSLSPNVLERFKKYEYQRVQREALSQFYFAERCHNGQRKKQNNVSKQNKVIKTIEKINSNTNRQFGKILKRQLLPNQNQKLEKTFKKNSKQGK